jgi:hypothetical protein
LRLRTKVKKRLAVEADTHRLEVAELGDWQEVVRALDTEAAAAVPTVVHPVPEPVEVCLAMAAAECQPIRYPRRRFPRLIVSGLLL